MIQEEKDLQMSEDIILSEPTTKSQARADFGKLLTIILLKIGNATFENNYSARKAGIDLIDDLLAPFQTDPYYLDLIKKAEKIKNSNDGKTPPHEDDTLEKDNAEMIFLSSKLKALMSLMHRAGLIGVSITDWSGENKNKSKKSNSPIYPTKN